MRRKPTYQGLANATLAGTKLGAVTQPYVPYNDNALAVNELRTMTDRLALEARANQGTQAQVFATAVETGLPPQAVQQMVNQAETQQRLVTALGAQLQQAQTSQEQANQRNTEQVLAAIGAQAQAHQGHINTMNQVGQSLRGSVSNLEQAAAGEVSN